MLKSDELRISEAEIENLIKEVDVNEDKMIDYNEFIIMMKKDLNV